MSDSALIEAFLEMLSAERGARANTLDAYARDLEDAREGVRDGLKGASAEAVEAYVAGMARRGLAPAPVEARHRKPGDGIPRGAHVHVVLRGAPEAVLGREQTHETGAAHVGEQPRRVIEPAVDRSLVGQEPDAAASQQRAALVDEDVESGEDGRGHPSA